MLFIWISQRFACIWCFKSGVGKLRHAWHTWHATQFSMAHRSWFGNITRGIMDIIICWSEKLCGRWKFRKVWCCSELFDLTIELIDLFKENCFFTSLSFWFELFLWANFLSHESSVVSASKSSNTWTFGKLCKA